jgi:chromatin assembly factor 1 subunit B
LSGVLVKNSEMKCQIPEISWHNRDPVFSVDFQPKQASDDDIVRVASGGSGNKKKY